MLGVMEIGEDIVSPIVLIPASIVPASGLLALSSASESPTMGRLSGETEM